MPKSHFVMSSHQKEPVRSRIFYIVKTGTHYDAVLTDKSSAVDLNLSDCEQSTYDPEANSSSDDVDDSDNDEIVE